MNLLKIAPLMQKKDKTICLTLKSDSINAEAKKLFVQTKQHAPPINYICIGKPIQNAKSVLFYGNIELKLYFKATKSCLL